MNQTAFLDYAFLFDPSETWRNLFQFEADLIKFFESQGIEAETLKPVEGQYGKRILVLKKKPMIPMRVDDPREGKVKIVPAQYRKTNLKG